MRVLELEDIICLLRAEVKRAGGQRAWAQKTGISRVQVNKVLNGHREPNKAIVKALNLRFVVVSDSEPPDSK